LVDPELTESDNELVPDTQIPIMSANELVGGELTESDNDLVPETPPIDNDFMPDTQIPIISANELVGGELTESDNELVADTQVPLKLVADTHSIPKSDDEVVFVAEFVPETPPPEEEAAQPCKRARKEVVIDLDSD